MVAARHHNICFDLVTVRPPAEKAFRRIICTTPCSVNCILAKTKPAFAGISHDDFFLRRFYSYCRRRGCARDLGL
jgi:hypothetical protein